MKKIYKVLLLIGILTICATGCGQKKVKDDRGELVRAGEIPRPVFVQKESSKSLKAAWGILLDRHVWAWYN